MRGKLIALVRKRPVTWTLIGLCSIAILVGSRWLLGQGDWAGLGQWVGGLGAFVAAWTALRIANGEARRENARETERLRVHAYYVGGGWTELKTFDKVDVVLGVQNRGTEPVLNVELVAVHISGRTDTHTVKVKVDKGRRYVLLPGDVWRPEWATDPEDFRSTLLARFAGPGEEVEITFEDLAGTRWRRIGSRPPVLDGEAAS